MQVFKQCLVQSSFSLRLIMYHDGQNTMLVKRNATLIHEFFMSSLEEVVEPPPSGGPRKILNPELRFF